MKKTYLYGVCVLFLFLLQFAPLSSFAESASGTTTAEVTFTQGPIDSGGGDDNNNNIDKDGDKGGNPADGNNIGSDIKDKMNDFIDKNLPNTGEQQKLYLIIIGTCLIIIAYFVFRLKKEK
jgi:LPXTG-motif cell wall-anchored protein